MSHTQVQYLKKQVERKDAQILVLLEAFESLSSENEFLASVACGFAWDLVHLMGQSRPVSEVEFDVKFTWDDAVAAANASAIALREAAGLK